MKLDLTLQEINLILQTLGNAPYASVFELIQKIREQAQAQVNAQKVEERE